MKKLRPMLALSGLGLLLFTLLLMAQSLTAEPALTRTQSGGGVTVKVTYLNPQGTEDVVLPLPASAWNIPGHMLSGAIAYQVLRQENPPTIEKVKAVLERHPWYANQWQSRLQDLPVADNDLMLFMQAARWPDDIRIKDKVQNRPAWHYINLPFKPEGQPDSVQAREPEPVNILTALAENERVVKNENDAAKKAIALAWLFHLVGDIHLMLFMQAARWPDDIRIQ